MKKIILICGPGLGKSFVGNAMEQVYKSQGLSCDRVFGSERGDLEFIAASKADYVIVESNYLIGKIDVWQVIRVSGGQPDPSAR